MRRYKVIFFNPETLQKRVMRFTFKWDYYNHCWEVTTVTLYGENTRTYCGEPINLVNHAKELVRNNEYVTIKVA